MMQASVKSSTKLLSSFPTALQTPHTLLTRQQRSPCTKRKLVTQKVIKDQSKESGCNTEETSMQEDENLKKKILSILSEKQEKKLEP